MEFSYTYFEDEVRDGFYVPGIMKQAWAAQLEILEDIRKVCEKHKISYYAEWGTLLGAVRHGGFIPWDDDLDLCMKRSDYNKFLAAAPQELPKGYKLLNFHNDDYWEMLTRVVNGDKINFDKAYLEKFHGFPYVAGIDIFPLDFVAPDEQEEILRGSLIKHIMAASDALENESIVTEAAEKLICQVEEWCNVAIDRSSKVKRQLFTLAEQLFSLYSEEESDEITLMNLLCNEGIYRFPKYYYENAVMLPFENTMIPVPTVYDGILRIKYGDYMKPVRSWDNHEYPFFKKQLAILSKVSGVKPHKYLFSMSDLRKEKCEMNKNVKKKAFELAGLLGQMHAEIRNAVMRKDISAAMQYLEECQNSAVSLGTLIESSEGEDFVTVHLLEEYCELVYQIHTGLVGRVQTAVPAEALQTKFGQPEGVQTKAAQPGALQVKAVQIEAGQIEDKQPENLQPEALQIYDRLCGQIESIKNSIQRDIKERITAVFLPYKASMWDSLESIWQAAEADPDCDAYVIPIPYYDKNPDGSFHEMHYEGDQYPDYVPITKYDTFDFGLYHPDMIYIHNPYDEYNLVTSVHPFFYSKNLKQYTERLIYVSYFILDEINPNDRRAIANMEHFVTVPGVINADQVIVQSEQMRQTYIRALTDFAGTHTRSIWEKKILGTGSPKIDKVMRTNREDLDIPADWLRLIQKPDGSWKKIVLYNTSVSALLQYKEQALKKIADVFEIFKMQADKTVLLWRPHPLIESAIGSMRPQLRDSYKKLVQQYIDEGWGIYDDTADLDRAIVLCNGYYGDYSSVVLLVQNAGRPIFIQNNDFTYNGNIYVR